jgi:succinoglycan biosynthesis protein ExoL
VPLGGDRTADLHVIGALKHGHYLQRAVPLARALGRVYRETRASDVLYCFGADVAVLAWIVGLFRPRLKVVLEVGDIRPIMIERGFRGRLLRALERILLRRLSVLVVTSPRFRDDYFVAQQRALNANVLVVENKVEASFLVRDVSVRPRIRAAGRPIVIGYYGVIRCRRSWTLLERLSTAAPERFQIIVWGHLALDEAVSTHRLPAAMTYRGEYRNPDDVPVIYDECDIVWDAYAHAVTHSQWARTNRFYEACYFARPLIGQVGTPDGDEIEQRGIGFCVDLGAPDSALEQIMAMSDDDLARWTKASRALDSRVYAYTDEHDELMRRLRTSQAS